VNSFPRNASVRLALPLIALLWVAAAQPAAGAQAGQGVGTLRVEYLDNPIGLDVTQTTCAVRSKPFNTRSRVAAAKFTSRISPFKDFATSP
jgi:hypothetical protein